MRRFRIMVGESERSWPMDVIEPLSPWAEPFPAEMTIHSFFQSVWPAMRMRTQPSRRPFTSGLGALRPASRNLGVNTVQISRTAVDQDSPSFSVIRIR